MSGETDGGLLYFNGLDAATGEYLTPPLKPEVFADRLFGDRLAESKKSLDEIAGELGEAIFGEFMDSEKYKRLKHLLNRIQSKERHYTLAAGYDPNRLESAGWGVVFAARNAAFNDDIKSALRELLNLRREQCKGPHPEGRYVEITYNDGETADQLLGRLGVGSGSVDPKKGVPYYLLLVGNPDVIPYRLQYELDVQYAVGRIHFDTLQEYASYARSVVDAETGKVKLARRAVFFGPSNPNDWPTSRSSTLLVEPLAQALRDEDLPGWNIGAVLREEAKKARLRELLGGADTPALLFTAGHGLGGNSLDTTGALVCQDWRGPYSGIQAAHFLSGRDIDDDASMLGLVAFFFACYGAGIPSRSQYSLALVEPDAPGAKSATLSGVDKSGHAPQVASFPFVSRLPRRLLGHPKGGALAVVGHIERAWPQSFMFDRGGFQDLTGARKDLLAESITDFKSTLQLLLGGAPLGFAMEGFNGRYAELATKLAGELEAIRSEGKPPDKSRLAGLWLAGNDARNYVIVGDPAVRLPVAAANEAAIARRPIGKVSFPATILPVQQALAAAPTAVAAPKKGGFAVVDTPEPPPDPGPAGLAAVRDALAARLFALATDTTGLEVATYVSDRVGEVAFDARARGFGEGAERRFVTRLLPGGEIVTCAPAGGGDDATFARHALLIEKAAAYRRGEIEAVAVAIAALSGLVDRSGGGPPDRRGG